MQSYFEVLSSLAVQCSKYSPLLAIGIGIRYYKFLSADFQFLFFILIYGFINDQVTSVVSSEHAWPLNNIYFIFETMAMGFVMIKIEPRATFRKLIRIIIVSLFLFWCATTLYKPEIYFLDFNRMVLPIRSAVLSILAGIMIYDLSGREVYLFRNPAFWVLVGFFIYLFCNMIVFLSISLKLKEHQNIILKIWFLHNTISTMSNLIYAYAFYLTRRGKYYAAN